MKNKILVILGIVILSVFLLNSCKRDNYTFPDLTGPAVKDLYAVMNVGRTILKPGTHTSVVVKVVSNQGPVENAHVDLRLRNYDTATLSRYGHIDPKFGTTDKDGIFRATLYAPTQTGLIKYVKLVAHISGDPYKFNNRTVTVQALIVFTE